MRRLPALALLLVLVPACNSTQKDCEHARDVMVRLAEEGLKEALAGVDPAERPALEKQANAEIEELRSTFVGHCTALSDEGKKCIARIDEFLAVDEARKKATEACPKDDIGLPEQTCSEKARADADANLGACKGELDALAKKVYSE